MANKNELVNRAVSGLVVVLAGVIAGFCLKGNAAVSSSLTKLNLTLTASLTAHKDAVTPHAGIAVTAAQLKMIEVQLAAINKKIGVVESDIKTILKEHHSP